MLRAIGEGIWAHEKDLRLGPGMRLPSRATLLRLADGQLLLHAPLALDEATAKEIDALGDVRFLVAPNCYHWMFLAAAKARYPKARVFAPAGLARKIGGLPFEQLPARGAIDGADGVRVTRIDGAPMMEEHVFLHEPSRSLLLTDLVFNVQTSNSFGARLMLRLVGAWKQTTQSRTWRLLVKDRAAAAASAEDVLGWEFDRVVVAHGEVVEGDAPERARRALAWMTRGAPARLGSGSARHY